MGLNKYAKKWLKEFLKGASIELPLIILGVFLGLYADSCSNEYDENEFTKNLVFELRGNLKANLEALSEKSAVETKNLKLNRELLHLIDSKGNCEEFKDENYKWMVHFDEVNLEKSAYNTFKSFGFAKIKSDTLRLKLINLYEKVYPESIDQPYAISKSRYESVNLNIVNKNFFYDDKKKSWKPYDCDSLFLDKEYKSLISFGIEWKEWRLMENQRAIKSTRRLLKVVDSISLNF